MRVEAPVALLCCAWKLPFPVQQHSAFATPVRLSPACVCAGGGVGGGCVREWLQEMIQEADRDGDGVINADEFYRVMKKRSANPLDDLDSDDE